MSIWCSWPTIGHDDWIESTARSDRFVNRDFVPKRVKPWWVVRVELDDGRIVDWPEADVRPFVPGPRRDRKAKAS